MALPEAQTHRSITSNCVRGVCLSRVGDVSDHTGTKEAEWFGWIGQYLLLTVSATHLSRPGRAESKRGRKRMLAGCRLGREEYTFAMGDEGRGRDCRLGISKYLQKSGQRRSLCYTLDGTIFQSTCSLSSSEVHLFCEEPDHSKLA